jgi:hypothetical protein
MPERRHRCVDPPLHRSASLSCPGRAALEDLGGAHTTPSSSLFWRRTRAAAPMPRSGRNCGNLVGVAVEPEDGWRCLAPVRHPGGGKRRRHDGFQIAPSSGRSLGIEAPLEKVKLAAPAALGPVTRWWQRLARSSAVRAQRQAKERDGENILAHGIMVGPRSHGSGVSEIFSFAL